MPYSSVEELPAAVRDALPEKAQRQFLVVFNAAHAKGDSDDAAFAQAWGAIKNSGWEKNDKGVWVHKAAPRPLYVYRPLLNAARFISWAKGQGFQTTLPEDEMHVTIAYSRTPVDWMLMGNVNYGGPTCSVSSNLYIPEGGPRLLERLGEAGDAVVLLFASSELCWRHAEMVRQGASWDWPSYQPHITITFQAPGLDLSAITPYDGPLEFGPEKFEPINDQFKDELIEKMGARHSRADVELIQKMHDHSVSLGAACGAQKSNKNQSATMDVRKAAELTNFFKFDEEQRIAYGWASVISEKGQPVVDLQGDIIRPAVLTKAVNEFMMDARHAMVMHSRNADGGFDPAADSDLIKGVVLHSLPLTAEIAKSLGIQSDREGWIVGVKVLDDETWKGVKNGTLAAFSIGGGGVRVPVS